MNDVRLKVLESDIEELSKVLSKISNDFYDSNDEYENELFYFGLHKAKEFCENLKIIIKHRGENNDII